MHGFLSFRRNNLLFLVIACILLLLGAAGCGSSTESEKSGDSMSSGGAFLAKYEDSFVPSAYDPDLDSVIAEARRRSAALESVTVVVIAMPETIPGFRIQILFTGDIEQANQTRDSAAMLLPDEWVYVVYDAPYYKVRVGNFTEKMEANPLQKKLISMGYKDAWIVPDHIIKNPPPKVPETFIVPERLQEEQRR
jgi:hypothetical protein